MIRERDGRAPKRPRAFWSSMDTTASAQPEGAEADAKLSRRFISISLDEPMETAGRFAFMLRARPYFAEPSRPRRFGACVAKRMPMGLPRRIRFIAAKQSLRSRLTYR
jgi:hypothetical protein